MKTVTYAPEAFRILNGIFCVYKPAGVSTAQVRRTLAGNLARDLNLMETRPQKQLVQIEGSLTSGKALSVKLVPNLADHPLVVGLHYQPQDFRLKRITYLGKNTSGVLAMGINDGCKKANQLSSANVLRKVEIKGKFGIATDNFMLNGKVIEKATYGHIYRLSVEKMLGSIQASHQADSFVFSGIDIRSQEAYEVASKGIIRPHGKSPPLVYNIQCTEFDLPHFTIELMCINETEEFLCELIHRLGLYVKSCAVCCQIRQVQYGQFTLDHALLRKHWTLEHILGNIMLCKDLAEHTVPSSEHFHSASKSEIQKQVESAQKEKREHHLF